MINNFPNLLKKVVCVAAILLIFYPQATFALSDADLQSIYRDTVWYDSSGATATACSASAGGTTTGGSPGGSYALDELKAFAYQPITSTWNISDSTVEQWFLNTRTPVIGKYGLTPGNIGQITSVVKAAGVSPVFFYAYTVSEGGGAGGFINHFKSSLDTGIGPTDAKRDAEYLAAQSKIMTSRPSWYDAGNPVYFVPQDVQDAGNADFQKMPSGSIGRAYIPATAAATWEVYYPNGLKAEYNKVQDYGAPLGNAMRNIKGMGGDPLQGGASISAGGCTPGVVAGQGMAKAINWAVMIANNDGYGYDQPTRETGWVKWKSDPNCVDNCGSFDCSSFISAALTEAGYFSTNPNFSTVNEASVLEKTGFTKVASSATSTANLQPGDILIRDNHTAMYIGNNQIVHASINENGQTEGGQAGDQSKTEIYVREFSNDNWTSVWRAST